MAMNFVSASSQRLTLSSSLATFQNVTGGTIMCWVNLQGTLPTTETLIYIYSVNGSGSARFSLSFRGQLTKFRTSARRLDADSVTTVDSTTTVVAGTLYHICAVAEFNNTALRLYVNGVQENSATIAGWTAATSNTASTSAYVASNSTGSYFNGLVTDVRSYSRALTAQEVLNVYGGRGRDSVVLNMQDRWKMAGDPPGSNGTPQSIGLLQAWASQTNNPLYAENMGISSRRRSG